MILRALLVFLFTVEAALAANQSADNFLAYQSMQCFDPASRTKKVTIQAPTLGSSWTLTLPTSGGSSNQFLQTNGSGTTTWATPTDTGVTTMGAFGASPNGNAGTISGSTLTLQPADATNPGGISTTTQTLAGAKTFSSTPTFSTMTVGSVLFAGTSGILSQDNSKFFYDSTNHKLGIGTTSPAGFLHVVNTTDGLFDSFTLSGQGASDNNSWEFYASAAGTLSIWNKNQILHGLVMNTVGNIALGGGGSIGHPVSTVVISNQAGTTTTPTLALTALASQSADLQQWLDSSETVLAKVTASGAGSFAGLTNSSLGAGVARTNSSGVFSSAELSGDVTTSGSNATTVAKIQSTTVSGTTGSGNVVFATSPTITTPSIAKLSNLTTNGYVKTGSSDGTLSVQTVGIPVADGGTGQTSYTDGQLLIGNSSGNTLTKATLTQGSGITITNGNGSITIAATGSGVGASNSYVDTGNGRGSTNTRVRRFTNVRNSTSDLTYADSATSGGSWTVNTAGGYVATYCDGLSTGTSNIAISVNGSALTTNASSITYAQGLRGVTFIPDGGYSCVTASMDLSVNDVVRAQEDGNTDQTNQRVLFNITRMK